MTRRNLFKLALPLTVVGIALAQKKEKVDRLSGSVVSMDADKMTIEMHIRKNPNQRRKIFYDATTSFTLAGKPAKAADVKPGNGIVALGKFQGVDLKANRIALTLK